MQKMTYNDPVYGRIDIEEPVILELINSAPVQRLKKITQHGPSVYNRHYKKRVVSRFEHSLGVYALLCKFGVSIEEKIAGLLHDIGHTVFSHTVDFLFPEEGGEYDKKFHKKLILWSEIPEILKKHKIDLKKILDEGNFPVLERPLPDLCADRIDYFLRDPHLPEDFDKEGILDGLVICKEIIVFKDTAAALYFSRQYMEMNDLFWANHLDELLYFLMVDIMKIALKEKLIAHSDLFLTEDEFLRKIQAGNNKYIDDHIELIKNLSKEQVVVSETKIPSGYLVKSKIRIVDPQIFSGDKLNKLSEIDPEYKKLSEDFYRERSQERWIGYAK